jgi:hypothetical protein
MSSQSLPFFGCAGFQTKAAIQRRRHKAMGHPGFSWMHVFIGFLYLPVIRSQSYNGLPYFRDYNISTFQTYPQIIPPGDNSDPIIEHVSDSLPEVYLIHNALSDEECAFLRSLAFSKLRPSYVGAGGQAMKTSERRTSKSTFLVFGTLLQPLRLGAIRQRLAKLAGLDIHHFFDLQVNYYEGQADADNILRAGSLGGGGKYEPHLDWAASNHTEQAWTLLLCLSSLDDDQGGETVFVRKGIKVRPKEGMVIAFRNILEPGVVDVESLHGGMPLRYGTKWNANQWVLTQRIPFARRISIPFLLIPWGGDIPAWFLNLRNLFMRKYGSDGGYRALNMFSNCAAGGIVAAISGSVAGLSFAIRRRNNRDDESYLYDYF